ncbi:hypothetical protein MMC30_001519, partial [Trapelia coarctata]|nr:hypothetical protein [Trapelia coarctata]
MRVLTLLATVVAAITVLIEVVALPAPEENAISPPSAPNGDAEKEKEAAARKAYENSMKYFHEPGSDDQLGHYDSRYFNGLLSYEKKRDTQVHMVRAYLDTFREKGIETWIAHGTLLGWWWNGKMLPWDWDIDTQVSDSTLTYLATQMNHTFHNYTASWPSLKDKDVTRTFLLDVNPHYVERVRGDGFNIIDARWIDVRNGLYIDITGLSETHPDILPGILSGKNLHRYKITDLYPMRETMYEGVVARVPYAYDPVLTEEYSDAALVRTLFEG